MPKANRRRRRQERRAYAARCNAQQLIPTTHAVAPALCPLTDISQLKVSPEDVAKAGVTSEPMRWVVVSCAPAGERKALAGLRERRFCAYLPMHRFRRLVREKFQIVERPLMVGYLFAGLTSRQTVHDLAAIDGVVSVLEVNGRPAVLSPWTVLRIAAMEASGSFDHTGQKKSAFTEGQPVKITGGQFIGWLATVVSAEGDAVRVALEGRFKGEIPLREGQVAPRDVQHAA